MMIGVQCEPVKQCIVRYCVTNAPFYYIDSAVLGRGRGSAPITRHFPRHVESDALHAQLALQHHELLADFILLVLIETPASVSSANTCF